MTPTNLISSIRRCLCCDCSVVAHLGLVDDQLTLALAEVLDLNAFTGNDELAVDEEFDWGVRILDLLVGKMVQDYFR